MNVRKMAIYHHALAQPLRRAPAPGNKSPIAAGLPRWTSPAGTYIICTNPRSGSWLLSDGLAATHVAGNPREWFNTGEEQQHRARWRMEHSTDLDFANYLRSAKAESTTGNGISGIKMHYYQFAQLPEKMAAITGPHGLTAAELMPKVFPNAKYIWLTRRDKVRQAISFLLASNSNQWWSIQGYPPDQPSESAADGQFDPQAIARMERLLEEHDSLWQSYFENSRIAPLRIEYDDLVAGYAGAVASVLKWLGIPNAETISVPPSSLQRQSNARNEEWFTRYTALKNEGGRMAPLPSSDENGGPLPTHVPKTLEPIPNAWKEWVGHSKLLNATNEAIVQVLTNNGYNRAKASSEVEKAARDPYLLGAASAQRRLRKGASILNALGQLARLDAGMRTVERRSNLSRSHSGNRNRICSGRLSSSPGGPGHGRAKATHQNLPVF